MQTVNNNPVNFTARINLRNIDSNLKNWQKASLIAEEKTKKIPYDFNVEKYEKGAAVHAIGKEGLEHYLRLTDNCMEKLASMTPEKLAEKITKVLKLFAKEDVENVKIINILTHLENSKTAPKNLFYEHYAKLAKINEADTRLALSKDKVFDGFDYI